MRLGIGEVVVLVAPVGVGNLFVEALGYRVIRAGVIRLDIRGADDYFSPHGAEEVNLLFGLFIAGREDTLIAPHGSGDGQAHARIARGTFDNRATGFEQTCRFGILDHLEGHAVFDRVARIGRLDFGQDRSGDIRHRFIEFDQGRIADGL